MASTKISWRLIASLLLVGASALLGSQATAQDNYPLRPGDVLGLEIASEPRIKRDLTIGIDGSVVFPLIGQVSVAGRTITELQAEIPVLYSGAVYRERAGGEDILVSLRADDTFLEVVRYRPVYLDGLVREPGPMPFEVGLTARQAISFASGIGLPLTSAARKQEEIGSARALSNELVRVLAEMARLRAVLDDAEELDASDVLAVAADDAVKTRSIDLANQQLDTARRIFTEQIAFIEETIASTEEQIVSALREKEAMTDITESEESEVERIAARVARSAASTERLGSAKRVYLQAVERLRNVTSEYLGLKQTRRELMQQRDDLLNNRRLEALASLRDMTFRAAELREALLSLGTTSSGNSVLGGETSENAISISIHRMTGKEIETIKGDFSTFLQPGDVVFVELSTGEQ